MPCQKYQIFIFIFIFCNRNANFCYFLQWQCNLFNFFCIGNAKFLILAFAIQMFCIFCIGNILFFHFWHWECKSFFIFGTGNAFFKNFWHWECKFLLFFALGMQFFFIFCTGNANFFYFQHWWKWHNFENIFAFQMHEIDNLFLQPIPSRKTSAGLRLRLAEKGLKIFKFFNFFGVGYKRLQTSQIHVCIHIRIVELKAILL